MGFKKKLEVGMFVSDREYGIGKVDYICDCVECIKRGYNEPVIKFKNHTEYVTSIELEKIWFSKAKHNLVDLIKMGDVVKFTEIGYLGEPVTMIWEMDSKGLIKEMVADFNSGKSTLISIITKEQFESTAYGVK